MEHDNISQKINEDFNLSHIDIGPPIATGCSAAVYAASLKTNDSINVTTTKSTTTTNQQPLTPRKEMMSPIRHTSQFLHSLGGSVNNLSTVSNVDIMVNEAGSSVSDNATSKELNVPAVKSVRFDIASNIVHSRRNDSLSSDEGSFIEVCRSIRLRLVDGH